MCNNSAWNYGQGHISPTQMARPISRRSGRHHPVSIGDKIGQLTGGITQFGVRTCERFVLVGQAALDSVPRSPISPKLDHY
jgi:hypothetical protein